MSWRSGRERLEVNWVATREIEKGIPNPTWTIMEKVETLTPTVPAVLKWTWPPETKVWVASTHSLFAGHNVCLKNSLNFDGKLRLWHKFQ